MNRRIHVTWGIILWICLTSAIVFSVFFVLPTTEFVAAQFRCREMRVFLLPKVTLVGDNE